MCISGEKEVKSRVFIDCERNKRMWSECEGEVLGKESPFKKGEDSFPACSSYWHSNATSQESSFHSSPLNFLQCFLSVPPEPPPPAIFLFYSSISLLSVSFLSGPQWLPHINSQTGSQDPVSQYLSWELPGRSPSWQPLALKDMDRSSIPGRAHWFLDASNPRRYEKGPWRGLPCANFKFILDLGILIPQKIAETLISFQCTEWNERNVKTRNSNIRKWTVALLN